MFALIVYNYSRILFQLIKTRFSFSPVNKKARYLVLAFIYLTQTIMLIFNILRKNKSTNITW